MEDKPEFKISVRNLVEYILRSGDIDMRRGSSDLDAMLKGGRLHRKIQKQMKSGYRAEVTLKFKKEYEDLIITLEGRADGIFEEDSMSWVDEIKGLASGISHLEEPVPVHLAQAKCYAAMLMLQDGDSEPEVDAAPGEGDQAPGSRLQMEHVGVQMTYGDLDTEEIRRFRETEVRGPLLEWFGQLLDDYHKWLSFRLSWVRRRDSSIKKMVFPFEYRPGQRKLAGSVYHTIDNGRQIFVQAPTGIGKTMAVLFPSIVSLGEGKADALFYLTARTTTRTVAEESLRILQKQGLLFKAVTITAKEKMCQCGEVNCNPDYCPYARGYEDRVNDAVFAFLQQDCLYDREAILQYALGEQLCPFEFTLDLSLWVDGIVCDYNYVFDPDAYLRRFFGEGKNGKYIFLIDEAHNLADRSREMYSAVIRRKTILEARKKSRTKAPPLARALNRVNKNLLQLEKETEDGEVLSSCGALPINLLAVQGEMEKLLQDDDRRDFAEEILEEYFEIRRFMNTFDLLDENYVIYTEKGADKKVMLRLFCVNPAKNLSARLEQSRGTVFFSATLLPMRYYRKLLSVREDDYGVAVPSPFPRENRRILACHDVSSRYRRRGYDEYRRIAAYISCMARTKKGNYMVFFPSYAFLNSVLEVYEAEFASDSVRVICQQPDMGEKQREEFMEQFREQDKSLAAFCTMGGIFSEGIDLSGNRLIGAAIIGPGIPQVSTEREILKGFYDRLGEDGYDYAYRFPGMNKVLQAAGRVIRTDRDRGTILLMDERFLRREYEPLMPPEWSDRMKCSLSGLAGMLEDFWESRNS